MTSGRDTARDLRDLAPPRPLEIALDGLAGLERGDCLHLVLRHEPKPLFALLPDRGIRWITRAVASDEVHVLCWRSGDERGEERARASLEALGPHR